MASRKRSRRPAGSLRRIRRSVLPLLENLEDRLVLSLGTSTVVPPNLVSPGGSGAALLGPDNGLVPIALAHGGTVWLQRRGLRFRRRRRVRALPSAPVRPLRSTPA